MEENKYHFAREVIFNLRSCHAITQKVYLHWIDKLNKDEKLALKKSLVSNNEVLVCKICGKPVHPSYNLCFEHLVCNKANEVKRIADDIIDTKLKMLWKKHPKNASEAHFRAEQLTRLEKIRDKKRLKP